MWDALPSLSRVGRSHPLRQPICTIETQVLKQLLREPLHIVQQRTFLQELTKVGNKHFAQGGPSSSVLVPYMDSATVGVVFTKHKKALVKLGSLAQAKPARVQDWKPCITAFAELVAAEEAIIQIFRDLQQRIISALNKRGADKSEDSKGSSRIMVP